MNTRLFQKKIRFLWFSLFYFFLSPSLHGKPDSLLWLDDLPIQAFSEGIRPVKAKANYQDLPMKINGQAFSRGIGLQSVSVLTFFLEKKAERFQAIIGADDMGNPNIPITFFVMGDEKILFQSQPMNLGDAPIAVNVDLKGITRLGLLVTDEVGGINNKRTYGNWADARLVWKGENPPGHFPNNGKKYILTPKASKKPLINSPKVYGASPDKPILFKIAATGERPLSYKADGLPPGLSLDAEKGIISGRVKERGTYRISLLVRNTKGEASQHLDLIIGDKIALTSPMGWNGWNSWHANIDREKVLSSANALASKGLIDYGWSYVNVDDTWQGVRGGKLNALQPNEKFPDIKGMVDAIHAMGLKAGIYSTPYIATYGGYPGASSNYAKGGETHEQITVNRRAFNHIGPYRFEKEDALQLAEWGFDFLKYDWRIDVESTRRMSEALKSTDRDILLSLSNSAPFEKAEGWQRYAQMYRTGPDIRDSWGSLFLTVFSLDKWAPFAGPGTWPDADMMILGNVETGAEMHPTRLTPDEQYSHVSLYALLSAPMLIGCPIEQLDDFTLSLLTNREVNAIHQDPLGKWAVKVNEIDGIQTWVKPLEDGSLALGLFNTGNYGKTPQSYVRWGSEKPVSFLLDFSVLGLTQTQAVRDVWQQKDLGSFQQKIRITIPYHGVKLFRVREME